MLPSTRLTRSLIAACALTGALTAVRCVPIQGRPSVRAEFWGFTAPWDPRSTASVTQHAAALDAVVSGWITLDSASFAPALLFPDSLAKHAVGNRRYMALVTSYHGNRFHPETVRGIGSDSAFLAHSAGAIAALAARSGYRGLILDFEGMTPDDFSTLRAVVSRITDSARAHGISPVGVAIPATDTAGYPARPLAAAADFVLVMLYDQHWLTSPPGPIASPEWVRRALGVRLSEVGPGKIVAALPTYGYQWRRDSATAVLSFQDAQQLAAGANTSLERDVTSATLRAQRTDGTPWTLWVADAELLRTLVRDARSVGVTKFAFWRLGLEDPAIWPAIAH